MNIVIVFPQPPTGVPSHFKCGDDDVWIRSRVSGLRCLPVDTLVMMPGCSPEQIQVAVDKTLLSINPVVIGA